jgi:hypothetical protein
MMDNKPTSPAPERTRVKRSPIGQRNKLSVEDKDPNYHYRIVNKAVGRVEQFIEQGYEVAPKTKIGDKRVDNSSALGSASEIAVGGGTVAVLMRQRKDWYDEDQATKQKAILDLEATMNEAAKKGT